MIVSWFPWIFIGGLIFIALSFVAAKYKDKEYKKVNLLQDFISGSILIGFVGVLIPDIFPRIELPNSLPVNFTPILEANDLDLQIGPPRLAGR